MRTLNSTQLQHFQQFQVWYVALLLSMYVLINNSINATSQIMEAQRDGALPFMLWEPFVWEYSSAVGTLLLFPALLFLLKHHPFNWQAVGRSLTTYFAASVFYCLLHVAIMVGLRKLIYGLQGRGYDFGLSWFELVYEYRKDLWAFLFFIVMIKVFSYLFAQIIGEASTLANNEDEPIPTQFDRFLVKKLGKEFIVKVSDIDWLESSGNYVNLHSGERIYPLRATLTQLSKQLEAQGFCRIHRSHAIKLDAIESITPLPSGDSEITLHNGKKLNLSRRYKEQFKLQFA